MLGFFRKKALKVVATNLYQELIIDHIRGENALGRTGEQIAQSTGLNPVAVFGMLNRLIEYGLIEEIDTGELSYRAINIPDRVFMATSPNEVFAFSKHSVDKVSFSGL